MKTTFLILCLIFITISDCYGDQGGPDAFGYKWRDSQEPSISYNFLDTTYGNGTWTRVTGLGDDNFVGPFNMDFPFYYYGNTFNQFWTGSNGYIKFAPLGNYAAPFSNIPFPSLPNLLIAGFGCDFNFVGTGNPGKCYYYTNHADTLIVSFIDIGFWVNANPPYTGSNTFQIILAASDSTITFNYKKQQGILGTDDISIGIEDSTGQIGLQYLSDEYPTANRSVKFFPPSAILGISSYNSITPDKYQLEQNYPNPFNPSTRISFSIPKAGFVTLKVYDNLGREVSNLVSQNLAIGSYEYDFNGENLQSGVYFYKLQVEEFIQTRKMLLVK